MNLEITHVRKDTTNRISHVKIVQRIFPVGTVASWIRTKQHYVYTKKLGTVATVYARVHPTTKRTFLTTEPDGIYENNLEFLPAC